MSSTAKGIQINEPKLSSVSHVFWTEGKAEILRLQDSLNQLSDHCGQSGALDDLEFFLSRPTVQKKLPVLVRLCCPDSSNLVAAVLLYQYRVAGRGIGIFSTDDTTGHRTLVSPPELKSSIALLTARELIRRKAHTVFLSFQHDAAEVDPSLESLLHGLPSGCRWASRERQILGHLPLRSTFDETLATMGKKTRAHLRYYRRLAESDLGCAFAPEAKISRAEFLELNRKCAYAVSDEIAGWRYDSLKLLREPVLVGVYDRDGHWISVAGGRRIDGSIDLHWLLNREDLPSYSLSTVIRCYLIESEIGLGTRRLYIHGGTSHSMKNAFVPEKSTDLLLMRSQFTRPLQLFAQRMLPPENMLRNALLDETLSWKSFHSH